MMTIFEQYNRYKDMDPTAAFADFHNRMLEETYQEFKHQRELEELEDRLYKRIMKDLSIEVVDKASPVIANLNKELAKLGGRK